MITSPPLPQSLLLDIAALSAAFRDTETSYKFLWMQALLRAIERGDFKESRESSGGVAPMPLLVAHMLDIAKYPVRRFHLFLGRQDRILISLKDLEDSAGWHGLEGAWGEQGIAARYREIPHPIHRPLVRFVPYRFLSPFFAGDLQGLSDSARHQEIIRRANLNFDSSNPMLYRFVPGGESIELHPAWKKYLQQHAEILRGWILWHWCNYLQKRNPNIPAISQKLAKPEAADLTLQRRFWRWVIGKRAGEVRCIYSGDVLSAEHFAVDHYVPWDFIGHDNLWNLIPAKPEANSAKSNWLPTADYFPAFVRNQHLALSTFCGSGRTGWNSLMESYSVDLHLPEVPTLCEAAPELEALQSAYARVIPPLLQLAENCGFRRMS